MDAFTVRPATRADLPAVARLAAQLVRLHHGFDPQRFLCVEPLEPGYERFLAGEKLKTGWVNESDLEPAAIPPPPPPEKTRRPMP